MSKIVRIQNSETGEIVELDTSVSRYKRLGQGFLNNLRLNPAYLKHVTLTQRKESYKPNILNPFFVSLRRYYGAVSYIWTAEVQERRAEVYGESVLHWHIIVAFNENIEFGKEDIFRLQKYWKYGNLDVKPIRHCSISYLMKYISKSLSIDIGQKIHRIGSSFIAGYLRVPWQKFLKALQWFVEVGAGFEAMGFMQWNYKGARLTFGDAYTGRETRYIYLHPRSDWHRISDFDFSY